MKTPKMCRERHNYGAPPVNVKMIVTDRWSVGELARCAGKEGSPIRYTSAAALRHKTRLKRFSPAHLASAALLAMIFSISGSGCSNSLLPSSANTANAGLTSLSPTTTTGSNNNTNFSLTQVVRTTSNPGANFDLLGDGTGAIGQSCVSTSTGNPDPTQPSTCVCSFHYIRASGAAESIEAPSIYRETDLLRCAYTMIPSDVTYVDVSIHVTTSNIYSSSQRYNFEGNIAGLSLADSTTFQSIKRYQCKDTVVIDGVFSSTHLYDPIQSEDPFLAYPLNFYTGNMGGAIASFIANPANIPTGPGWNCPTTPNDTNAGLDLTVYSVDRDAGSNTIYPANATSDRSTFFLAKRATGVFAVAVNAFIAPFTVSSSTIAGTPLPPIGYGAAPIPLSDGTETCPDTSVTIPSGYKWVKVWLFRASLEDRKFRTSTKIQKAGPIYCNPGNWAGTTPALLADAIFQDCTLSDKIPNASGTVLADRILYGLKGTIATANGVCIKPLDFAGVVNQAGGSTIPAGNAQQAGFATFALGTDIYKPWPGRPAGTNCAAVPDQLGLCDGGAETGSLVAASDNSLGVGSLDGGVSRYDYLFVVSPTSVNALDFKNATPVSLKYTPYRFYTPNDCLSGDPDNPLSQTDCLPNKMIHYGVKFADITTNGDAPSGNTGRLPVFPVCALQQGP